MVVGELDAILTHLQLTRSLKVIWLTLLSKNESDLAREFDVLAHTLLAARHSQEEPAF